MDKREAKRPRRVGPEDEDRQSQLDDDKRETGENALKEADRRVRKGGVDDTDLAGRARARAMRTRS